MFTRNVLAGIAVLATTAALTSSASADQCLGLDCPGVTPASSQAHALASAVETPQDLERATTSGFYDFGTNGPERQRAIAYVIAGGTWDSAPPEVQQLPAAQSIPAGERDKNTIVIYGPRTVVSVPPVSVASAARARAKRKPHKARAAAFSDCPSGWFCLFDNTNGTGARGQWSSTGYWQHLADFGWQSRGVSMNNRRNGWTLLQRYDGAHYCAVPNSQDGSLSNNGYYKNTTDVYLSTATTKHAAWNCTN